MKLSEVIRYRFAGNHIAYVFSEIDDDKFTVLALDVNSKERLE